MDHGLLVRVLDALARPHEQLEAFPGRQPVPVAVLRDRHALDVLHHEVGTALLGRAGVEHLGDVRMVHQRQRLALGFEPGDDLLGVHPPLDDLERHLSTRRLLLGEVDLAHSSFADLLPDGVVADLRCRAGQFGAGLGGSRLGRRTGFQQRFDFSTQPSIALARVVEELAALPRLEFTRFANQVADSVMVFGAHTSIIRTCPGPGLRFKTRSLPPKRPRRDSCRCTRPAAGPGPVFGAEPA